MYLHSLRWNLPKLPSNTFSYTSLLRIRSAPLILSLFLFLCEVSFFFFLVFIVIYGRFKTKWVYFWTWVERKSFKLLRSKLPISGLWWWWWLCACSWERWTGSYVGNAHECKHWIVVKEAEGNPKRAHVIYCFSYEHEDGSVAQMSQFRLPEHKKTTQRLMLTVRFFFVNTMSWLNRLREQCDWFLVFQAERKRKLMWT